MPDESHLTTKALGRRWRITTKTLVRWRHEGIGPVFLKLHGRVLYRLEDIEQYEKHSLQQQAKSAEARE